MYIPITNPIANYSKIVSTLFPDIHLYKDVNNKAEVRVNTRISLFKKLHIPKKELISVLEFHA